MPTSSPDEPYIPNYDSSLKGLASEITHIHKCKELRRLTDWNPCFPESLPVHSPLSPVLCVALRFQHLAGLIPAHGPSCQSHSVGIHGAAMYWPVGPACKAAGFSSCHGTSKEFSSCPERAWCHEFTRYSLTNLASRGARNEVPVETRSREGNPPRGWQGTRRAPTDLIKGDFFRVPVLNIEEHDHSAILVPRGEDTRVASLNGAADGLRGQAVEELWVLQPEVHVAWQRRSRGGPSESQPLPR